MRWGVQAIAGLLLVATSALAWAQTPEGWDRYLNQPRGPYRGQVIDADTRAPLAGAVVVAYWPRDRIYPFHSVMEHYAVREVLTDADGRFVIDGGDIERSAPKRTLYPRFLIFIPGYGSFPRLQKAPTGFTGGIFEGDGALVELPRLESPEARRGNLYWITPNSFTDTPFTDLSQLMKKINEERGSIGLSPHVPAEQR
jgi:hypothetical protein